MKTVVVYKSESGFTKKYAEWIAEEMEASLFEASNIGIEILKDYDTIIYGGGLYAVGINGISLILNNLDILKNKKIIVYATGASPSREEALQHVIKSNFTSEQLQVIKFFYLRGGFDYSKLGFISKILMILLKLKLKLKKNLEPDERGMLNAYNKPVDFTNKNNIDEIIKYAKDIN